MRNISLLLLLTAILIISGCAVEQYFPNGAFDNEPNLHTFVADWYSKQLDSLKETSLYKMRENCSTIAYRFVWLRTFHHPVAVRIVLAPDSIVVSKVCDGAGGYDPGNLIINKSGPLSPKEVIELNTKLKSSNFWELPSVNVETNQINCDGAQWIIEGVKAGKYHVVDRWSPDSGAIKNLGLFFLKLGNIDEKEIY